MNDQVQKTHVLIVSEVERAREITSRLSPQERTLAGRLYPSRINSGFTEMPHERIEPNRSTKLRW